MVKKAGTLVIDQLTVSDTTKDYLLKHFDSIDEIVREGRIMAFKIDTTHKKYAKWSLDLVSALRSSGYILPTECIATILNVGRLYVCMFEDYQHEVPSKIENISNEQYEDLRVLSKDELEELENILDTLPERERKVICSYYGLCGNPAQTLRSIAKDLGITVELVRQIQNKAIRKLRHPARSRRFPAFFSSRKAMQEHAQELTDELTKLYENPIFNRAREIVTELENIRNLMIVDIIHDPVLDQPIPGVTTSENIPIEELELNVRSYNCLRRAGIYYLSELLDLSYSDLVRIRHLGKKNADEIINRVRELGYTDFPLYQEES